jgi:hypothetical protein
LTRAFAAPLALRAFIAFRHFVDIGVRLNSPAARPPIHI